MRPREGEEEMKTKDKATETAEKETEATKEAAAKAAAAEAEATKGAHAGPPAAEAKETPGAAEAKETEGPRAWPPPGYMEDSAGRLVPERNVGELDKLRDGLAKGLVAEAEGLAARLAEFRRGAAEQVRAMVELAAQEYGVRPRSGRGAVTLTSYDGTARVQLAADDRIEFTEGLGLAKELVAGCLRKWSEGGAAPELAALAAAAFDADGLGRVSTARVLSLRAVRIEDPDWLRAMELISDSVRAGQTVHYLRFYRRERGGKWRQVGLATNREDLG